MIRRNQIQGLSAIVFSTLLFLFLAQGFSTPTATVMTWVLAWAGAESLLSFYGLSWSLERSNKEFFSIFGGGFLVRLISLGVLAYVVASMRVSPALPLLTLAAAYFLLSLVQLPFITHGLH